MTEMAEHPLVENTLLSAVLGLSTSLLARKHHIKAFKEFTLKVDGDKSIFETGFDLALHAN
jgi:hypothetical protein